MDYKLLLVFILFTVVNVVLQTLRSLATVKCDKTTAAFVNAVAYGIYTIVIVYTLCDLPLLLKAMVTALCNFIGVWVVKFIEEKTRKDKLWKIEGTVTWDNMEDCHKTLDTMGIRHNYIDVGPWAIFNCYCYNKEQSAIAKKWLENYNAKFFVSESEVL